MDNAPSGAFFSRHDSKPDRPLDLFRFLANALGPARWVWKRVSESAVPAAPVIANIDSQPDLVYALHITNFRPVIVMLTRIDVLQGSTLLHTNRLAIAINWVVVMPPSSVVQPSRLLIPNELSVAFDEVRSRPTSGKCGPRAKSGENLDVAFEFVIVAEVNDVVGAEAATSLAK